MAPQMASLSVFPLEKLPEEVILNILTYFKLKDLMNCSQASKRIRRIAQDEKLWQRVDVNNKKISTEFLEMVLDRGCHSLDISLSVTLEDNINIERSELRHLDVSNYRPANQVIEKLLNSCHYLEKLAMRNLKIWPNLIFNMCIQNCHLQILNLANCEGTSNSPIYYKDLEFETVKIIVDNCKNLKEINFYGAFGSRGHIDSMRTIRYLVENITENIEKIDLGKVENVDDDDVRILAERCKKLKALNLEYTQITNGALTSIIEFGLNLEELSVDYCYTVEIEGKILELGSMPELKVLNFDRREVENLGHLQAVVPNLQMNKKQIRIAKFWISDPCLSHGNSVARNLDS